MFTSQPGGFCIHCGNWVDGRERCECATVNGLQRDGGADDHAAPDQEDAIRWLEDALSLVDDSFWDQAL